MKNMVFMLCLVSGDALAGGYVRLDIQRSSELRLGGFVPLSDVVALAPQVRASSRQVELDLGVTADIGALFITGWVGGGLRLKGEGAYLSPGLSFAIEAPPLPLYLESWTEFRSFRVFGGDFDEMLKRDLILIPLREGFAVGVQIEPYYTFPGGLQSLHVGPRVNLGFGRDALGLFAGWDTGGKGFMGRVTLLLRFE